MDESLYLPSEEQEQPKPKSQRTRIKDDKNKRATKPPSSSSSASSSASSSRRSTSVVLQVSVLSAACMLIAQKTLLRSASQSSRGLSSVEEQATFLPNMKTDAALTAHLESSPNSKKYMKHVVNDPQQIKPAEWISLAHKSTKSSNVQESTEGPHSPKNLIVDNKKVGTGTDSSAPTRKVHERDSECIFRDSPLYRSIYVYPSPIDKEWEGEILSEYASNSTDAAAAAAAADQIISWPWLDMDQRLKQEGKAQYDANNKDFNQYTTELLVRDIITHPDSCLRTKDPESASLFYIPYLPTMEYHNGSLFGDYETTPFSQAMLEATSSYTDNDDGKYDQWEKTFGLTSKYWKRQNGADHIVVMSEPLHGYSHPRNRRGNYHYLHSQKQLSPPIVISIELSTTFVEMYPRCARKNILMPYPNTDGKWFNGAYNQQTQELWEKLQVPNISESPAALKAEQAMADSSEADTTKRTEWLLKEPRPLSQFYGAGNHGSCKLLRQRLGINYRCTESGRIANRFSRQIKYQHGYRQSTFCPCPGGDSPSAKRHFDALHAGCIPVILSHDFVWPFTSKFDKKPHTPLPDSEAMGQMLRTRDGETSKDAYHSPLSASDFALRLNASEFVIPMYGNQCQVWNPPNSTEPPIDLQSYLETLSGSEIERLRTGALHASDLYSYYKRRPDLPENPLREGILPDGGAAHQLVRMLSERAHGNLWSDCEQEQQQQEQSKIASTDRVVSSFKC